MEDEGCEAIEHERTWAPLIEERRGRGPNVFEPTRVHVPDPAERGHTEDVSAVHGRPGRARRHPKGRRPARRHAPEQGVGGGLGGEGTITQAPPPRWGESY